LREYCAANFEAVVEMAFYRWCLFLLYVLLGFPMLVVDVYTPFKPSLFFGEATIYWKSIEKFWYLYVS